jgi:hypothetical protein
MKTFNNVAAGRVVKMDAHFINFGMFGSCQTSNSAAMDAFLDSTLQK